MDISQITPLSLPILLFNLALGTIVSLAIAWYYVKFGNSLSNRMHFASIIPLLALITMLVISIVKSSLALSLGWSVRSPLSVSAPPSKTLKN